MPTLSVPIGQHALAQFTGQWTELAHELHVLEMQLTAAHAGRKDPAAIVRLSRRASRLARDFARDRQLFEL
nr:hypothetical protein [Gemmatimonadaceae bacterium]